MSSISRVVIATLWALAIWSAIRWDPPLNQHPPLPPSMPGIIVVLPLLFFGAVAVWGPRQSPFYHRWLAQWINRRYGPDTLESFLVRLRPLLMFGIVATIHGVLGLWDSRLINRADDLDSGFLLSAGLGFLVTHLVLYRRRAVGVFPTWTIEPSLVAAAIPERKTLREALRAYWWTLIGVAIFPTIFIAGGELFHIPFEFFALPFFGVALLAAWPWFSGRAPYSFWLVAVGVWFVGGLFTVFLLQLLRVATLVSSQ